MKRILSLVVCILAFSAAALAEEGLPSVQPEPEAAAGLVQNAEPEELTCEADEASRGADCKSGCNKKCAGASNKAKCVGTCRRACDGK